MWRSPRRQHAHVMSKPQRGSGLAISRDQPIKSSNAWKACGGNWTNTIYWSWAGVREQCDTTEHSKARVQIGHVVRQSRTFVARRRPHTNTTKLSVNSSTIIESVRNGVLQQLDGNYGRWHQQCGYSGPFFLPLQLGHTSSGPIDELKREDF